MESYSIYKRVYYDDTDAGGVVYHANYLRYLDHSRSEYLRQLGFDLQVMQQEQRLLFAVIRAELDYRKPARLGETLKITAVLQNFSAASLSFSQTITRVDDVDNNGDDGELLLRGTIQLACIHADHFKPVRIPKLMKEKLARVN